MGTNKKQQPERLPEKLLEIRKFLNLTQEAMFKKVNPGKNVSKTGRAIISEFESGRRTPSILELFHYAETIRLETEYENFSSDDISDDRRNLPWL